MRSLARHFAAAAAAHAMMSNPSQQRQRLGRVGSTLRARLGRLRTGLPGRFRGVVERVAAGMDGIEALPWVLTHGDLGAGNVLVVVVVEGQGRDQDQGRARGWGRKMRRSEVDEKGRKKKKEEEEEEIRLSGLVDWAEGEYLPFGVGLYGVEEVLWAVTAGDAAGVAGLRGVFWEELEGAMPELRRGGAMREAVENARLLGLLLW